MVVAIISILAAMLLPALHRAKQAAHKATCMNNLKQIGIAIVSYSTDHNGWGPVSEYHTVGCQAGCWNWQVLLAPYLAGPPVSSLQGWDFNAANRPDKLMRIYQCPSTWNKFVIWGPSSYGMNEYMSTMDLPPYGTWYLWPMPLLDPLARKNASQFLLVGESLSGNMIVEHWNEVRLYDLLHLRQRHYLMADGHVESCPDPIYHTAARKFILWSYQSNCEIWGFNTHAGNPGPYPPPNTCQ